MNTRRIGFSGLVFTAAACATVGACAQHDSLPRAVPNRTGSTAAPAERHRESSPPSATTNHVSIASQRPTARAPGVLAAVEHRLFPTQVTVEGSAATAGDALVDGRADTGLTGERQHFDVQFRLSDAARLSGLAVVATGGSFRLFSGTDASIGSPIGTPLQAGSQGTQWERITFPSTPSSEQFVVRWTPATATDRLAELELWGADGTSLPTASIRDEIAAGESVGTIVYSAGDRHAVVSAAHRLQDERNGQFEVTVANQRNCHRAFLRYNYSGVSHWASIPRTINGHQLAATMDAVGVDSQTPNVAVEEISINQLTEGLNRINYEPVRSVERLEYNVQDVSLICVRDAARTVDSLAASAEEARRLTALTDGVLATGLLLAQRQQQPIAWTFAAQTQLHDVQLFIERPFRGALLLSTPPGSTENRVRIPLEHLQQGWNRVAVPSSIPAATQFGVSFSSASESNGAIAEMLLNGSPTATNGASPRIALSSPTMSDCTTGTVHLRGFLRTNGVAVRTLQALVGATSRTIVAESDLSFALNLQNVESNTVTVQADLEDGTPLRAEVAVQRCPAATRSALRTQTPQLREDVGAPYAQWVHPDRPASLAFGGVRLELPVGSVTADTRVTVRPIDTEQVAAMDPGMTNVTRGGRAFRLGPHGIRFAKPIKLSLEVDATRLPAGTSLGDLSTFYYDESERRWRTVPRDGVPTEGRVAALTDHFTDFIAGSLASPDAPQSGAADMNAISGIQAANPMAGVTAIAAPGANASGAAATSFPILVPPGRQGMQPELSIAYASTNDNGWLGVGWDLRAPSIEVDTRFGVPNYEADDETYVLNGAAIVCHPNQAGPDPGTTLRTCERRIEGGFERIERIGHYPDSLYWIVTSRDGTKSYYGETLSGRLAQPADHHGIGRWYLERVEDVFGNRMDYRYQRDVHGVPEGIDGQPGEDWVQTYLSSIEYTSHVMGSNIDLAPYYAVNFQRESTERTDIISSARLGFDVRTRFRLQSITVLANGATVRSYHLKYETGDFGKSLLHEIEQDGANGAKLYAYQFAYHRTATDSSGNIELAPGVQWSNSVGEQQMHQHFGNSGGASLGIGVGWRIIHATGTFSYNGAGTHADHTMTDVDGDGLQDFVRRDSAAGLWRVDRGTLNGPGAPLPGNFVQSNLQETPSAFSDETSDDFSFAATARLLFSNGFTPNASLGFSLDWQRQQRRLMDVNGDGRVDMVHGPVTNPENGAQQLAVYLNPHTFNPPRTTFGKIEMGQVLPDYYLGGMEATSFHFEVPEAGRSLVAGALYPTDPVVRWQSPKAGLLHISGAITRLGPGGADGVIVRIYKIHSKNCLEVEQTKLWEHVINPTDGACTPSLTTSTGCGEGGFDVNMANGDRLYFRVSSQDTTDGDVVAWNPVIDQVNFAECQFEPVQQVNSNGEPNGCVMAIPSSCSAPLNLSDAHWSRTGDFNLADANVVGWTAPLRGRVLITGNVTTGIAGAVLKIVRRRRVFTDAGGAEVPSPWDGVAPITEPLINQIFSLGRKNVDSNIVSVALGVETFNVPNGTEIDVEPGDHIIAHVQLPTNTSPSLVTNNNVYARYTKVGLDPAHPDTFNTVGLCSPPPGAVPGLVPPPTPLCQLTGTAQQLPENIIVQQIRFAIAPTVLSTRSNSTTMRGWNRGWSYAEWNGSYDFDEVGFENPYLLEGLQLALRAFRGESIPPLRSFSMSPFELNTTIRGAHGNVEIPAPGYRGTGMDSYVTSTQLKPSRTGALRLNADGTVEVLEGYHNTGLPAISLRSGYGWTFTGGVGVGFGGSVDQNVGLNVGASAGFNYGNSFGYSDFYDVNGDRLPDAITTASGVAGSLVQYQMSNHSFSAPRPMGLRFGSLRRATTLSFRQGESLGVQHTALRQWKLSSGVNINTEGAQASAGTVVSDNVEDVTVADINGDGLPDHLRLVISPPAPGTQNQIRTVEYQLNLGHRLGAVRRIDVPFGHLGLNRIDRGFSNSESVSQSGGAGFFGIGGSYSSGTNKSSAELVDITGDGLPDHVEQVGANWLVSVNTGTSFLAPVNWHPGNFPAGLGSNPIALNQTASRSLTISGSLSLELYVGAVSIFIEPGANFTHQWSDTAVQLEDINGDGLMDHVARAPDGRIFARLSPVAAASNHLAAIISPLGARTELSYAREGNVARHSELINGKNVTVFMPSNQWVLKSVRTVESELRRNQNGYDLSTTFDYHHSGYYDTDERESYGFAWVTATQPDGSRTESFFDTSDYYHHGMPLETQSFDGAGHLWARTRNVHDSDAPMMLGSTPRTGQVFPRPISEQSEIHDGTGDVNSIPRKTTGRSWAYNSDHFVKTISYLNDSGTADDINVSVEHQLNVALSRWQTTKVTVTGGSGQTLQQRTATYRVDGTLESMTDLLKGGYDHDSPGHPEWDGSPGRNPTTTYEFDAFGNLKKVTDHGGDYQSLTYDTETRSHVLHTVNSLGIFSDSTVDLRFGVVTSVKDVNGSEIHYTFDQHARLTEVRGPYDLDPMVTPTIAISYSMGDPWVGAPQQWAWTRHKDTAHPWDPIESSSIVDGFGRPEIVKREVEIDNGAGGTQRGFAVNGRSTYDLMGRVVAQGQPTFSPFDARVPVPTGTDHPTTFVQDAIGRTITVIAPNGTSTNTAYGFEELNGVLRPIITVTDALGRSARKYTTLSGQVLALRQQNDVHGALQYLWTNYHYDPLGRLDQVTDANSHITSAQYDNQGRMVSLTNPDAGLTEWRYTIMGELRAKITANLRFANKAIEYTREHHRLTRVDYPNGPPTLFTYGPVAPPLMVIDNAIGRLVSRQDASGSESFSYGELGEIVASHRVLSAMGGAGALDTTTHFTYDSFNRVRSIRYPDDELVSYEYDQGGGLRRVAGALPGGAVREYVSELRYDVFGHRVFQRLGNGVQTQYHYDPTMQRLDGVNTDSITAGALQRLTYQYNTVGNISSISTTPVPGAAELANVSQWFSYDRLDQLVFASGWSTNIQGGNQYYSLSMHYDAIGNIEQKDQAGWRQPVGGGWTQDAQQSYNHAYTYNAAHPHQATQIGARSISFDLNGNQVSLMGGGEPLRTMTWDDEDRLTSVNDNGAAVNFRYDAGGTRTHRSSSQGVSQYANQWYSRRNGAIATKHIFAGGTRVASVIGSGATELKVFFHPDHLGSTQLVTNDNGHVREHYEQMPFGETWVQETMQNDNNNALYRFTGKELDPETGLYYFGARYYDPRYSQWLSVDPALGMTQDIGNRWVYSYAVNSPISSFDPDGRTSVTINRDGVSIGVLTLTPAQRPTRLGINITGVFPRHPFVFVQTWHSEIEVCGIGEAGEQRSLFVGQSIAIQGAGERQVSLPGHAREYVDVEMSVALPTSPSYTGWDPATIVWTDDWPDNRVRTLEGDITGDSRFDIFSGARDAAGLRPSGERIASANYVAIRTYYNMHVVAQDGSVLASQRWRHTQIHAYRPHPGKLGAGVSDVEIIEVDPRVSTGVGERPFLQQAIRTMQNEERANGHEPHPMTERIIRANTR